MRSFKTNNSLAAFKSIVASFIIAGFAVLVMADNGFTQAEKGSREYIRVMKMLQDAKNTAPKSPREIPSGTTVERKPVTKAVAAINPTNDQSTANGFAVLEQTADGVRVSVLLKDVKHPGLHGIHIHEGSSCADEGSAAGGHFNPHQVQHGLYPEDGERYAHIGDMGNIEILKDGSGTLNVLLHSIKLDDHEVGVLNRTIILHELEDVFVQPTGNAGGRIACGIITPYRQGVATMMQNQPTP